MIDKNCDINTNINENILIDNYVNILEINSGNFEKNENIYDFNDKDFIFCKILSKKIWIFIFPNSFL